MTTSANRGEPTSVVAQCLQLAGPPARPPGVPASARSRDRRSRPESVGRKPHLADSPSRLYRHSRRDGCTVPAFWAVQVCHRSRLCHFVIDLADLDRGSSSGVSHSMRTRNRSAKSEGRSTESSDCLTATSGSCCSTPPTPRPPRRAFTGRRTTPEPVLRPTTRRVTR